MTLKVDTSVSLPINFVSEVWCNGDIYMYDSRYFEAAFNKEYISQN